MYLSALSQLHFRNLQRPRLEFPLGISAIVGDNAAGKSNLLAAVSLGMSASFELARLSDSIRFEEEEAYVGVVLESRHGKQQIDVGISKHKKVVRLDKQRVNAAELAKYCAVVSVSPEDANLVHGAPSLRRGFVDQLLCKLSYRYALILKEYQRVLEQRNALLKQASPDRSLTVWTERLVALGNEVMETRLRAMAKLNGLAHEAYREISGSLKPLELHLASGEDAPDMAKALEASSQEERVRKLTIAGPHRDDMLISLGGMQQKAFGSRGEARTTSLALRVAEHRLLQEKHHEDPVLLIDDFSAELDAQRRGFLLEFARHTQQVLLSGTEHPPHYDHLVVIREGYWTPDSLA